MAARVGVETRTSWTRLSPVATGNAQPATRSWTVWTGPERRHAWTVSRWPLVAIPSASSTLPKWAEPATVRPLASNTPRSQSPPAAPLRRALITPVAGAVTWRWTYPAPPVKSLAWQVRFGGRRRGHTGGQELGAGSRRREQR